jgi:hypothetical protein
MSQAFFMPCSPSDSSKPGTYSSSPSAVIAGGRGYHHRIGLSLSRHWNACGSKYRFFVAGYVVMPEHVHLLVSEPEWKTLATALQGIKQAVSCRVGTADDEPFWQARYCDFKVFSDVKEDRCTRVRGDSIGEDPHLKARCGAPQLVYSFQMWATRRIVLSARRLGMEQLPRVCNWAGGTSGD